MKIISALGVLFAIAYFLFPFFFPLAYSPSYYNRTIVLIATLPTVLKYWWPRAEAFLRTLPLITRLLIGALFVFVIFADIKTYGFSFPFSMFDIWALISWMDILLAKKSFREKTTNIQNTTVR